MTQARRDEQGSTHEPSNDELIAAVARAAGVSTSQCRLEETPGSRVVIAGELAYKLKKRVDLGFLNFISLESRFRACSDEVRLNRRLAPEIYLGLAPVTRGADGSVAIGVASGRSDPDSKGREDADRAEAPAIQDWAVVMRAMPQERMLDALLERGAVGDQEVADLDRLIDRLVEFHRDAPRGPEVSAERTPDRVRAMLERLLECLAAQVEQARPAEGAPPPPFSPPLFRFTARRAREILKLTLPILEARRAEGRVVEGHGDLHGRNICMIPGAPVAYDCIEFSRAFRCCDVSAEIAFLAMDLDAHGRPDLADRVTARYAEASGDLSFDRPQRFFRLNDALVRSLVEWLKVKPGPDPFAASRRFAHLAAGYALEPCVILTCGLPGSGKSTIARRLALPLRAHVVRTDAVRKELAGLRPTDRGGDALYTADMTTRVYAASLERAKAVHAKGRHVIIDAAFSRRAERRPFIDWLQGPGTQRRGTPWLLVHATASHEELVRRLRAREKAGSDVSDADVRVLELKSASFEAPAEIDDTHAITLPDGTDSTASILETLARP